MTSVKIEETINSLNIEETKNSVTFETFDVWTDYYFFSPAQVMAEHKEVAA